MRTSLQGEMCELRHHLEAADCASAVCATVNWFTRAGEQALHSAKSIWKANMAGRLPDDLVDLLARWCFPEEFDPLETKRTSLRNNDITAMIAEWHRKLFNVLDSFCRAGIPRKVLCGFNMVDDLIFYVTSAKDFESLWKELGNVSPGTRQRKPQNVNDALACLIDIINDPTKQGKVYPDPATLSQINNAAVQAGLHSERFLGGAAGNMAYVLSQMGVEVHIHCPYRSDRLRWDELGPTAKYLQFDNAQYRLISAYPGALNSPHKITVGFQTIPGWSFPPLNVSASQPGRSLFIGEHPVLNPQYRSWTNVQVLWQGQSYRWNGPWDNDRMVWPYPAVLVYYEVGGQQLNIVPADALAQQLATREKYDVALLKDVGHRLGQAQMEQAIKKQLDELRRARIPIHVEISPSHNLAFLRYLMSSSPYGNATYWSAGLNPDELLDITDGDTKVWDYNGQIKLNPYLFPKSGTSEGLLQRFVRALYLLGQLELDWIYVHGNELDMAIWRKKPCELIDQLGSNAGEKLRDAMLLAKAAVVVAMIVRNPAPQLRQLINQRLAEGAALAVKGFWALLSFARELSKWAADRYGQNEQVIYYDLLYKGFYEMGTKFGVAVAPVFWPDEAQYLHSTGAGDYSSAVVAAYVWG